MIQIDAIAQLLRGGGVALLPTDTIYGLHALAGDDAAVARLVSIKARDAGKPFVILGASLEQLEEAGARFNDRARAALSELWPGPITAVVPLAAPIAASRGASTIAVRVPALDWLQQLLKRTGPLVSTSANRSGEPPLVTPAELSSDLQPVIDAIVDAGPREGKPSTIVDFTDDEPRLIREGESLFTQKVWKTLRKTL
jgi:tRNA threonylcarbamoyl adenosine modification protein (Sua5/YciO/YrdC/YwlC family)